MAFGLPVEGQDGPFVGERVAPVPTCDATGTVADVRRLLEASENDTLVVVAGDGLAVGEIDAQGIDGHDDADRLLDIMEPVPSTIRPSVTLASVAEAGGGRRLVSTSDGRLLGAVTVEAADGEDDHPGHDHGEVDIEAYESELTDVMAAVEERFGGKEPSEEELRALLRERLVSEGRSAEDADRFLDQLES